MRLCKHSIERIGQWQKNRRLGCKKYPYNIIIVSVSLLISCSAYINDPCDCCTSDEDCDNGDFCNDEEYCDAEGLCQAGPSPCPEDADTGCLLCDEETDKCLAKCTSDSDCDNGDFCDGQETCDGCVCLDGTLPCGEGECNAETQTCE